MRHLRMLNEEYATELATAAILNADLDDLVEELGDDWSIADELELDLPTLN